MDSLRSREGLDSLLSRESAFLAQNVLFLVVAFVTLWGTIFPVFSEAAQDVTLTVGAPFFNRINGPLLLAIVFLMGVGPLLPWRRATPRNLARTLRYPLIAAAVTGVVLFAVGVRQLAALVALSTYAMVITGIAHEWMRGVRARHGRGENYALAFARLLSGNRPRYGGYVVHLAIIMLAVGATASSFYSVQRDVAMSPGETSTLGRYTFSYLGVTSQDFPDRTEETAEFDVYVGDEYLGRMYPFRAVYPEFRIASTRGAIRSTPVEDFYLVPSEFNDDGSAIFRVLVNPMVWWMWASGPLLALGVLLAVSPRRQPSPSTLRLPANVRAAGA